MRRCITTPTASPASLWKGDWVCSQKLRGYSMGGYVLQHRVSPGWEPPLWRHSFSQPSLWHEPRIQYPQQDTTSYRDSGDDLSDDVFDVEATSAADFFNRISADYQKGPTSTFDTGHTFTTNREELSISERKRKISNVSGSVWYEGPLMDDPTVPPGQPAGWNRNPNPINVGFYGPRAINATLPTKSIAALNVGLAEIAREGIPHAVGAALSHAQGLFARAIGQEYLNYEFGWKPLMNDVFKACHAVVDASRLLRQYERDSGRNVRRRFRFPVEETVQSWPTITGQILDNGTVNWSNYFVNGRTGAPLNQVTTSTREVWFSGAYTYHLPDGHSLVSKMERFEELANHLLGLEVTPEVLWKLAPWSWLVDWVVNIGDNISNISHLTSDGLVIRYGYLMVTDVTTQTRTLDSLPLVQGGGTGPLTTVRTTVRKERFRATPFGFGLNTASFTDRQWAILGALGMTKGPTSLRR